MIITKEQQEKLLNDYNKRDKPTVERMIGFVQGIKDTLELVDKEMIKDRSQKTNHKYQ